MLAQSSSQLICDDQLYGHSEIVARVNQAANALAEAGVEPEHRVLLCLEDGLDFVAALLGALRLGAAVVMLNPELDPQEMREWTRARLVVDGSTNLRHPNSQRSSFASHPDDIALWLFSGGTTGRPKAVLQSHSSFINTTELYAKRFLGFQASDRVLAVPKLFFGYATGSNLFFPLAVGATAILFRDKCTTARLLEQIERHRPSILVNVPTMVKRLLQDWSGQDLSCLRFSTSAGEALPEALLEQWQAKVGSPLLDGLGTAEMWHIFLSNHPQDIRPGSLGKPVPGFEVMVADDQGRPLPPGEVGQLWVAGDSRAQGYWQLSQLSQQAFRGRYFVSSDLVRQDEEGYFYYCGRADELLKVCGRWLAPQEVESALLTHPAVRDCCVVGEVDGDGLVRPQAFVIAQAEVSAADLQRHVLDRLEAYKHPRSITFVSEFPWTHLGKVDRKALRGGS